ncbi:hypothetical protein EXS74_00515 [Candidatus Woesearchaeota archaeon]|nr:hypothetical protein [Candidatus Woesearchaeota archaeon]
MKIALCGRPGSGKSPVAKRLAQELQLKHYSTGDYMRKLAIEQDYTIEEFTKKRSKKFDEEVDSWMDNIGKTEDNFIFDSRLAFHFIPDAVHIFLDVSYEESVRRVFKRRIGIESEKVEDFAKKTRERGEDERARYLSLYNIDTDNLKNYDAYIDTTGLSIDQVITEIKRVIPALRKEQISN